MHSVALLYLRSMRLRSHVEILCVLAGDLVLGCIVAAPTLNCRWVLRREGNGISLCRLQLANTEDCVDTSVIRKHTHTHKLGLMETKGLWNVQEGN